MNLNLPILDQVAGCQNLLIAGMGGGFDLFCGLPIYFELSKQPRTAFVETNIQGTLNLLEAAVQGGAAICLYQYHILIRSGDGQF